MTPLPDDIINKIDELFPSTVERQQVTEFLRPLWKASLNVGPDQLARSILTLSNGELSEVEKIFSTHFLGDSRDVVMQAERKIRNPGHYFINPFVE